MSLAHVRRGSGPPLVLIHGIGSQWQMWKPVLDRVSREREVVALDLPGFGDSEEYRARPTVEALASAVAEFLDGIGLGGAHVAGNSLGGGVALAMARAGTARSACLVSPAGFINDREGIYARAAAHGVPPRGEARGAARGALLRRPGAPHARVLPPRRPAVAGPGRRGRGRVAQPRHLPGLRDDVRGDRGLPLERARSRAARSPSPGERRTGCSSTRARAPARSGGCPARAT